MKQFVGYIFALLVVLMGCTTDAERTRMRSELDSINVLNRTDQPFTVQDVEPYVSFFDQHGTANDRLLAHYLLGRAYYEQGEAPMALQCYQDAVECADTIAKDFDFYTLSSVYSQMATLYRRQLLLTNEIEARRKASHYAFHANQLKWALYDKVMSAGAYMLLNKNDSAENILKSVLQQYRDNGYTQEALRFSKKLMLIYTQNPHRLADAKALMDQFETESDLFDEHHELPPSQRQYYDYKGRYFEGIHQLDSAEYYYRKIYRHGMSYVDQDPMYRGLLSVFSKRHQADSIAKYAQLYSMANDSSIALKDRDQIAQMTALYNYTRHQEAARKEKEIAAQEKAKRQLSIAILLLVVIVAAFVINKMYRDRKKKQAEYVRNLELLEQTQSEVLQLREHAEEYEELIAVKEKLLEELSARLQEQRRKSLTDNAAIDKQLQETDIYRQLEASRQNGTKLTIEELRESRKLVLENLPDFSSMLMSKEYKMSQKDFDLCVLFRLGFKSKEVSNMLGLTQGRVSQICTKILRDVFKKDEGGAAELINILHEWC